MTKLYSKVISLLGQFILATSRTIDMAHFKGRWKKRQSPYLDLPIRHIRLPATPKSFIHVRAMPLGHATWLEPPSQSSIFTSPNVRDCLPSTNECVTRLNGKKWIHEQQQPWTQLTRKSASEPRNGSSDPLGPKTRILELITLKSQLGWAGGASGPKTALLNKFMQLTWCVDQHSLGNRVTWRHRIWRGQMRDTHVPKWHRDGHGLLP